MSNSFVFYLACFLKHLGLTLLPKMAGGSFSPRALTISNTVILCLAYVPPLLLPFDTESDLSGNARQKSPVSSAFTTSFSS